MAVETLPLKLKPRYRGVSHQVGFFVAIVAGLALFAWAKPGVARGAAAVFGGSVALLLGTSALYHRRNWEGVGRERMRRLDLFKSPGVAETIDWTNALVALNTMQLDPASVQDTLGVLLKHQDDLSKMQGGDTAKLLDELRAKALMD